MNRNSFYLVLTAGLLLSNILLAVYLFTGADKKGFHPDKPRNTIIERLHFDAGQVEKYDGLIRAHRAQIREKDRQIRDLKKGLYRYLKQGEDSAPVDSATTAIAAVQKEIETIHYAHFLEIRNLCTPAQIKDYDLLVDDIADIFSPKPPK